MSGIRATRLTLRDLFAEALAGLVQRPGRSVLTMLGTVLGVGAFVAVLGLTSTATGQIGKSFSLLQDTTVTVDDLGGASTGDGTGTGRARMDFPRTPTPGSPGSTAWPTAGCGGPYRCATR